MSIPLSPEDRRRDILVDQGVTTEHGADLMLGTQNTDEDRQVVDIVEAAHRRRRAMRPSRRVNRRGGRSYREPSDSDLDEHWHPTYPVMTPEQREAQRIINQRGLELARAVLQFAQRPEVAGLVDADKQHEVEKFIEEFEFGQAVADAEVEGRLF